MKKRLIPAISVGIAVLIIGSIAYAADRKKILKTVGLPVDRTQEEETLRAELLNVPEYQEKKPQDSGDARKLVAIRPDNNKEQQKSKK